MVLPLFDVPVWNIQRSAQAARLVMGKLGVHVFTFRWTSMQLPHGTLQAPEAFGV